jgi:hypothetical protein
VICFLFFWFSTAGVALAQNGFEFAVTHDSDPSTPGVPVNIEITFTSIASGDQMAALEYMYVRFDSGKSEALAIDSFTLDLTNGTQDCGFDWLSCQVSVGFPTYIQCDSRCAGYPIWEPGQSISLNIVAVPVASTIGESELESRASVTHIDFPRDYDFRETIPLFPLLCGNLLGFFDAVFDGTAGPDYFVGTDGNDLFLGKDGDDVIIAKKGDDCVYAGAGNDFISGRAGDDELHGEDGDDFIRGNNGNDLIYGEAGNDRLMGDDGMDTLHGGDDDDMILGGKGNDTANGNDGNDFINGNRGDDNVFGDAGDDIVVGGQDNDDVSGGADVDTCDGYSGTNTINPDCETTVTP